MPLHPGLELTLSQLLPLTSKWVFILSELSVHRRL
jgi:hypothetical protein